MSLLLFKNLSFSQIVQFLFAEKKPKKAISDNVPLISAPRCRLCMKQRILNIIDSDQYFTKVRLT